MITKVWTIALAVENDISAMYRCERSEEVNASALAQRYPPANERASPETAVREAETNASLLNFSAKSGTKKK